MKLSTPHLKQIIREELLKETQWGGFTGGAAPLDEPSRDSGPIPHEQLKRLWTMFSNMGMSSEEILATPEFREAGIEDLSQLKEGKLVGKGYARSLIKRLEDIRKSLELFDATSLAQFPDTQEDLLNVALDVSDKLKYLKDDVRTFRERLAPTMGPGKSHGIHIDDRTGELLVAIEDELGASNFLDAVLQRMGQKEMKSALYAIAKQHKIDIGYKQL